MDDINICSADHFFVRLNAFGIARPTALAKDMRVKGVFLPCKILTPSSDTMGRLRGFAKAHLSQQISLNDTKQLLDPSRFRYDPGESFSF